MKVHAIVSHCNGEALKSVKVQVEVVDGDRLYQFHGTTKADGSAKLGRMRPAPPADALGKETGK